MKEESLHTIRNTKDQFKSDFEEFPPKPLELRNFRDSEFSVRPIGRFRKAWMEIYAGFRAALGLHEFKYPAYYEYLRNEFGTSSIQEEFQKGVKAYEKLNLFSRAFTILILLALLPLVIVFVVFKFSSIVIRKLRQSSEFDSVGGFFHTAPEFRDSVYINSSFPEINGLSEEQVITHEHIHLLQGYYNYVDNDFSTSVKRTRSIELVMQEKFTKYVSLLYLLERNEVEARLHEVVLSYYRWCGALPLSLSEFVCLLALNEDFGFLIDEEARRYHMAETSCAFFDSQYATRSPHFGKDFQYLLLSMHDASTVTKYCVEVLAPMYVNLLRYYGDEVAAITFGKQIQRPCLYDRIYLNRILQC